MIKLLPLLFLLYGCSSTPEKRTFVLNIKRSHVEMHIDIEDNFTRFGENVNGYAVCADENESNKGYCTLILPELNAASNKYDFCTWGTMLGFVVYGQDVMGKEKIDVCNER